VTVNAYRSTDPEGAPLSVRCDFGDGQFTGGEGAGLSKRFGQPGRYLVRARVTDAAGNVSVSSPVPLRVLAAGPSLASGVVNDGTSAQRSTVNSVQLRFDRPVVPGANALRLSRPGGGSVPPMTIGNPSGDGEDVRRLVRRRGSQGRRLRPAVQAKSYLAQPMTGGGATFYVSPFARRPAW
jgi:hypothetical protein